MNKLAYFKIMGLNKTAGKPTAQDANDAILSRGRRAGAQALGNVGLVTLLASLLGMRKGKGLLGAALGLTGGGFAQLYGGVMGSQMPFNKRDLKSYINDNNDFGARSISNYLIPGKALFQAGSFGKGLENFVKNNPGKLHQLVHTKE